MTPLQGSCHCGPVAYQVDEEPATGAMDPFHGAHKLPGPAG